MPLPAMKTARRCRAKAKSTQRQCQNPAAYGMPVCRLHGARKRSTVLTGTKHPGWKHGQDTNEAKTNSRQNRKLLKHVKATLKKLGSV